MAGRPKPTALKLLNGSAAHHPERVNREEPKAAPLGHVPDPPYTLRGRALDEWRRLAPRAVGLGVLTDADLPALAAVCHAYSKAMSTGTVGWHKAYMDGLARFGLDPANRGRLHVSPASEADPLDELLKRAAT